MNNPEKMLEQIILFCKEHNLQFMWNIDLGRVKINLTPKELGVKFEFEEADKEFFLKSIQRTDLVFTIDYEGNKENYSGLLLNIFKTNRDSFFNDFNFIGGNKSISLSDYLIHINKLTKKELENDIKRGEFKQSKILMDQMNFCFFIEMMPNDNFTKLFWNTFKKFNADPNKLESSVQGILNFGFMDSLVLAFKKHEAIINTNLELQIGIGRIVKNYIDIYPVYTNILSEYFPFLKTLLLKDRSIDIVSQEESHQISYSIVIDRLKLQKNLVFNNVDSRESQDVINYFKGKIDLKFKPYGLKNSILLNDNPVKIMLMVQFTEDAKITSKDIDLLLNSFIQNIVYSNLKGKELSEDKMDKIFNKTIMNLLMPEKMEINNKKLKL